MSYTPIRDRNAGHFVEAIGTQESMRVYREEIGLAAGIWTGNMQRTHRIANRMRAGNNYLETKAVCLSV